MSERATRTEFEINAITDSYKVDGQKLNNFLANVTNSLGEKIMQGNAFRS